MNKCIFIFILTTFLSSCTSTKEFKISDINIQKFPSNSINDLEFDSKGNSWMVSTGGNLIKFKNEKIIKTFNNDNSDIKYTYIEDIAIDKSDNIWIASGHLIKFNDKDWVHFNELDGFKIKFPDQLFIDNLDRVWFVNKYSKGISFLENGKLKNDFIEKNPILKKGLGSNKVYFFSENNIWTSSREMIFHYDGKKWNEYPNSFFNGSSYNYVKTLHNGSEKYWLGTWHKGLVSVDKKSLEFTMIDLTLSDSDSKFLKGAKAHQYWNGKIDIDQVSQVNSDKLYITSIAEKNNILYIGTKYNGLIIKVNNHVYNLNPKNSEILSESINTIKIDFENKIWIGTDKGLNILSYE